VITWAREGPATAVNRRDPPPCTTPRGSSCTPSSSQRRPVTPEEAVTGIGSSATACSGRRLGRLSPERALTITADVLESCGDDLNSPALSSPGSAMSAGSRSASVFAALTTTALLQVSSADVVRHPSVPLELCGCGRADPRPQVRCELRRGDLFGLILRIRRSWFICGVEQCCIGSRSAWTARSGPAALLSSAWSKMEPWQGKRARSF
jgi:hypothetical protein